MTLRFTLRMALVLIVSANACPTWAQSWTSKPVRIVLQFPPGEGSTPEEMSAFLKEQLQSWGRAFKEAGFQPE